MLNEDSFQYAIENTQVLHAPRSRIESFGNTRFRYYLITELMDRANEVRVRGGYMNAERPQIVTPGSFSKFLLDGFGEKGREFGHWLEHHAEGFAILRYGFQFRKTRARGKCFAMFRGGSLETHPEHLRVFRGAAECHYSRR